MAKTVRRVALGVTGSIGEVQLAVYLTHTWIGDLDLTLVAPDASTVTLARLINGGNIGNTTASTAALGISCGSYATFSDLGTAPIQTQISANLPLTGIYIPAQLLNRFNGKTANGTWILRIQDLGAVDVGNFQCGVLTVKPFLVSSGPSLDLNGDGSVDLRDLLFFSKHYGTTGVTSASPAFTSDLNGDGTVNDADLTLLLAGL